MKKIVSKPSVIVAAIVLVTLIALVCVCSPARVDAQMEGASDYMTSENIALGASVSEAGGGKAVDGKRSTSLTLKKKDGSSLTLDLGKEVTFNTIILKEEGLNVKDFEIFASCDGENFTRIFASDKIEYHRFCSVDETTARYVRLDLNKCDDLPSISEIEIYNEPNRTSDGFRVAGYVSGTWLDIAKNTSLSEEEKRAAVLEDMGRFNMRLLTHVFYYCGAGITEEGEVYFGSPGLEGEAKAAEEAALALVLDCMRSLNPDLKISMTFGIGTDSPLVASAMDKNRETTLQNLIAAMDSLGFDGIDIDYEFPVSDYDYSTFGSFLIALKERMVRDSHAGGNAILSCAFGTRDINYPAEVWDAIDIVNVMTYDIADQDGYHSSFWGCGPQAIVYYESMGVDRKKLNLGIPFYGTQIHALMEQYLYCDLQNYTSYDYYRNIYLCPDYLGKDMTPVYFNSPSMVRDKTAYALLSGMGGIMVWHTALDVDYSSGYSLWRAVATALEIYGGGQ